jgi:signal transduction histidine kinase
LHGLRDRTQLLGGQMEVFSKEGSGSIFYFQIPI